MSRLILFVLLPFTRLLLRGRYADIVLFEVLEFATEILAALLKRSPADTLAQYKALLKHFLAVRALPRIAAYLGSERRRPGLFDVSFVLTSAK